VGVGLVEVLAFALVVVVVLVLVVEVVLPAALGGDVIFRRCICS